MPTWEITITPDPKSQRITVHTVLQRRDQFANELAGLIEDVVETFCNERTA